ncbi:hypothetical protein GCM10027575_80460 [Phytohabitans suffuscus]
MQGSTCLLRLLLSPHPVDQSLHRNDPSSVHKQRGKNCALARLPRIQPSIRRPHFNRAQEPKLHQYPTRWS